MLNHTKWDEFRLAMLSLFAGLALGAAGADAATNRADVAGPMARRPANLAWRKDAGVIALVGGKQVVWQFNYQIGLDRLFFHPVAVAGGPVVTGDQPKDHPWHRGLWFSWKFINGVNYWEPNAQTGTLDGRTEWSKLQAETRPDFSARLSMQIAYRPADGPPVLDEPRVIAISAPAKDGSYSMDWQMTFTALEKAIVFDRTPLPGEPEGKPWGGYAGLSVRFAENLQEFQATSAEGPIRFPEDTYRVRSLAMDCGGTFDGRQAGVAILDHPQNTPSPTPWYLIRGPVLRYFSPAVIQEGPRRLNAHESFTLCYRVIVHPDLWSAKKLKEAQTSYASNR
ncbi:MAG: PmoA family protein [Verrucomicrobia bacterium]|nr:PmoA family protein [Verrucomicrobiota bacterium]